jgi:hypothetical protein
MESMFSYRVPPFFALAATDEISGHKISIGFGLSGDCLPLRVSGGKNHLCLAYKIETIKFDAFSNNF